MTYSVSSRPLHAPATTALSMKQFVERAGIVVLAVAALVACGLGIFQVSMAVGPTHTKLQSTQRTVIDQLDGLKRVLSTVRDHREDLLHLRQTALHASETAKHGPKLMDRVANLLNAVQHTLDRTAGSLRHFQNKSGLLTPGDRLTQNADAIEQTAARMRSARDTLRSAHVSATATSKHARHARAAIDSTLDDVDGELPSMADLIEGVHQTRQLITTANIAGTLAWRQGLTGGLYIIGGLILAALASLLSLVRRLVSETSRPTSE
jgi:methyl-accepting chemotaxis protein